MRSTPDRGVSRWQGMTWEEIYDWAWENGALVDAWGDQKPDWREAFAFALRASEHGLLQSPGWADPLQAEV
jgi:hypothetical protein